MANTVRTEEELLALFSDNEKGDISAQFLRDFVVSIYDEAATIESQQAYTPASATQWNNVIPTSVQNALDRIAAHVGPIPPL